MNLASFCVIFRVQRLSYVGELGYELFLPNDQAADLYDTLMTFNPTLAGFEALNAMSIEKGHHHWHADIGKHSIGHLFTQIVAKSQFLVR